MCEPAAAISAGPSLGRLGLVSGDVGGVAAGEGPGGQPVGHHAEQDVTAGRLGIQSEQQAGELDSDLPSLLLNLAAIEIAAGLSLLLGLWARVGALLAIPTMLGAIYAHLVIGVWPNGPENEPPIVLPVAVLVCAGYVLWRGAGRWSLDSR